MENDSICNSGLLDAYPLFSKEIVALIPYSNPLSQQERVKVSDLRNEKFNFYTEGHAIKHAVFRRCQEARFTPELLHDRKKRALSKRCSTAIYHL